MTRLIPFILILAGACVPENSTTDGGVSGGGAGGGASGGGTGGAGGGATTSDWVERSHTCPGINRVDALHLDDDGALWLGCGSGNVGNGLFRSTDEGQSWSQPVSSLSTMRVTSISRGGDGALYVGGTASGVMAVRVDTAASPMTATDFLTPVNTVGRQFIVGGLRVRADGTALAESLNGTDLLYRPASTTGASASEWTEASASLAPVRQMLDLILVDGRFVGAGSTIAQPPVLFLPSRAAAADPWAFEQIELSSRFDGELWGVAADAQRLVAVGVDQDADVGKIFVSGADRYEVADYTSHDVSALVGREKTWARGVCMRGQRVVVVGEVQPLRDDTGFVLLSDNGGESFTNITPPGVGGSVSKCAVRADGSIVAAGAGGWVGFHP